jgi:hypothetical protein
VIERFRHGLHCFDLGFQLQLFLHGHAANVMAACGVAGAHVEQATNFRQRESAVLRLFDEPNAAHRVAVIEPIAASAF